MTTLKSAALAFPGTYEPTETPSVLPGLGLTSWRDRFPSHSTDPSKPRMFNRGAKREGQGMGGSIEAAMNGGRYEQASEVAALTGSGGEYVPDGSSAVRTLMARPTVQSFAARSSAIPSAFAPRPRGMFDNCAPGDPLCDVLPPPPPPPPPAPKPKPKFPASHLGAPGGMRAGVVMAPVHGQTPLRPFRVWSSQIDSQLNANDDKEAAVWTSNPFGGGYKISPDPRFSGVSGAATGAGDCKKKVEMDGVGALTPGLTINLGTNPNQVDAANQMQAIGAAVLAGNAASAQPNLDALQTDLTALGAPKRVSMSVPMTVATGVGAVLVGVLAGHFWRKSR